MARPANQSSGSGDTNKPGKGKPPKKPPKKPDAGVPLYSWNGGPKTHTISQDDHAMHVADPLTKDPLYASAKQQATAYYAPQVNALNTLTASTPGWYDNYRVQAGQAAQAAQAASAPIIGQAQQFAQNIAAPASGLDPNSPEYQKSVQAGKGIGALAQFGAQNLQANQAADQTYFAGQQDNAARALPGVLAGYATQQGQLGSQVAGKTQEVYQGLRQAAVNEDIARQTLNVNASNTAADNAQNAANAAQSAADKKAARVVSRKNTRDRLAASTDSKAAAQAEADRKAAEKDAAKKAAEATKKSAAVQKATGKARVDVKDVQDAWARGGTMPAPTAADPNARRPATRDELRHNLGQQYGGTLVSIMERVRKRQALTSAQVQYLRDKYGPDFRVPREWLNGKKAAAETPADKPTTTGTGKTYRP